MEVSAQMERLLLAAVSLEEAAARVGALQVSAEGSRVLELEEKLREAEGTIATLRASSRRGTLQAKDAAPEVGGGVDAALASLPVEQRIAVKAQLMRSGLL